MAKKLRTNRELVDSANELARKFYKNRGYVARPDFKFYESSHPQEQSAWNDAVTAFDHLADTDIEDALANLEDNE